MTPRTIKKVAETDEPIIPPTREKEPKREETAAAVDATTIEVMTTMLECTFSWGNSESRERDKRRVAEREECSDCDWPLATSN